MAAIATILNLQKILLLIELDVKRQYLKSEDNLKLKENLYSDDNRCSKRKTELIEKQEKRLNLYDQQNNLVTAIGPSSISFNSKFEDQTLNSICHIQCILQCIIHTNIDIETTHVSRTPCS